VSKPPSDQRTNEQYYFDTLKRIASYNSPEEIQRHAQKRYGLDGSEAIEYAYDNVLTEARNAIKGMRRPRDRRSEATQGTAAPLTTTEGTSNG
jgi:hypothetical protein